jgi:hypothetical protein
MLLSFCFNTNRKQLKKIEKLWSRDLIVNCENIRTTININKNYFTMSKLTNYQQILHDDEIPFNKIDKDLPLINSINFFIRTPLASWMEIN